MLNLASIIPIIFSYKQMAIWGLLVKSFSLNEEVGTISSSACVFLAEHQVQEDVSGNCVLRPAFSLTAPKPLLWKLVVFVMTNDFFHHCHSKIMICEVYNAE